MISGTTYFIMTCNCILKGPELVKRYQHMSPGKGSHIKSCTVHKSRISYRIRKCHDCDNVNIKKDNRGPIAKRCPECEKDFALLQNRAYQQSKYRKQQDAKGLTVSGYKEKHESRKDKITRQFILLGILEKSFKKSVRKIKPKKTKVIKKSVKTISKNEFRNPIAAFNVEQAALRGVSCIPSENLFRFNAMMRGGLI